MDDVFTSGREQEDDMYELIAEADDEIIADADDQDDGSRYLNDSGEGMLEGGDEGNDLQLTTKSAEVYIYIRPLVIIKYQLTNLSSFSNPDRPNLLQAKKNVARPNCRGMV